MIDKIELTVMLVAMIGAMIGMISCGIVATVAAREVDWTGEESGCDEDCNCDYRA